jgi:hypothetical protein
MYAHMPLQQITIALAIASVFTSLEISQVNSPIWLARTAALIACDLATGAA